MGLGTNWKRYELTFLRSPLVSLFSSLFPLKFFPHSLPPLTSYFSLSVTSQLSESGGDGKPVVAIFFGANDASLKLGSASKQHVPIDEYKTNLCRMIEMIQPHAHALLISPPPVNEEAWAQHCNESDSNRSLEESKKYAKVVQEVSSERNLPFVDVWSRIYQSVSPDSKSESKLSDFFCDGLHLSSKGNQAVFEAFMEVVRDSKHIRSPDELPLDAELWDSLV